jgi:hypothetical protein
MDKAKRARTAETPKQPSLGLKLRAPYLYPDPMFDPITTDLIRTAPALEGLDLDGLPKRLTSTFADIVSARIRLQGSAGAEVGPELSETLSELRRLASAHETYVALLPERINRAAAAFVAASAHQACMLARSARIRKQPGQRYVSNTRGLRDATVPCGGVAC